MDYQSTSKLHPATFVGPFPAGAHGHCHAPPSPGDHRASEPRVASTNPTRPADRQPEPEQPHKKNRKRRRVQGACRLRLCRPRPHEPLSAGGDHCPRRPRVGAKGRSLQLGGLQGQGRGTSARGRRPQWFHYFAAMERSRAPRTTPLSRAHTRNRAKGIRLICAGPTSGTAAAPRRHGSTKPS